MNYEQEKVLTTFMVSHSSRSLAHKDHSSLALLRNEIIALTALCRFDMTM